MPGKDIAILKLDDVKNLPTLRVSRDSVINIGEKILVYGYPEPATTNAFLSTESNNEPTLTSGVVSAIKQSVGGWPVIQMDAMISHGSSGSPVCDEKGEVIGLATFGSLEQTTGSLASGYNFAIPVSVI
ncbi:MAG: serine protease [Bacteroidota bacterium]